MSEYSLFSCYVAVENEYNNNPKANGSSVRDAIWARFRARGFVGSSVLQARGFFEGIGERAYKVEIVALAHYEVEYIAACGILARDFGEDSVLVTVQPLTNAYLVKAADSAGHGSAEAL